MCENKQALVGGSSTADILALSDLQKRAIGRVRVEGGPPGYFCTGLLVAPAWVLTAHHCDQGGAFVFEVPGDSARAMVAATVVESVPNAEHDALLLRLDQDFGARWLGVYAGSEDDPALVGTPVDLAGFGVDADGVPSRSLNFLVERIARVEPETLVVDGHGVTGACIGDSGGPLLLRDANGAVAVAGILSGGSGTCTDQDDYVRADLLRNWILSVTGSPPAAMGCDAVTPVGFCRSGRAIWCEDEALMVRDCTMGTSCGFSRDAGGYRCGARTEDPCRGIDDLGACEGPRAVVCREGTLEATDCSSCDEACTWNASAARYACR